MSTPILKGLALGYAAPQILQFIARAFPSLSPKIQKAASSGYSVEQILSLINKGMGGGDELDDLSEQQIHKRRDEQQGQLTKDLLKAGVGALGTFGATRALGSLGLGGAGNQPPPPPPQLGQGPQQPPSPVGPHPMANAPVPGPPIAGQGQPGPNIAAAAQAQPTPNQAPSVNSAQILKTMGLESKIEALKQAGNSLESISAGLEASLSPGQKKWLGEEIKASRAKPISGLVQDYLQSTNLLPKPTESVEVSQEQTAPTQEFKRPSKGDLVISDEGILGNLKDIRHKEALVDSQGKLHKVEADKLIQSPIPEKDLADLYNDVVSGIEKETEEEVSRNVNWAGYDPKTNTLAYLPHLGGLYTYENIEPEQAKLLTSVLNVRKTSGENFIGAWKQGSQSPIGSAMSALIKQLQAEAGGKGKEYSHKFETLYSALEPAAKAAKKKKMEEDNKKKAKK